MVRGVVTQAKLCTVTVFQRDRRRKTKIKNMRGWLIKTKCVFLLSQLERRETIKQVQWVSDRHRGLAHVSVILKMSTQQLSKMAEIHIKKKLNTLYYSYYQYVTVGFISYIQNNIQILLFKDNHI